MAIKRITLQGACVCCGGDISATYDDTDIAQKDFAEAVDVCGRCWEASCSGMSLARDDSERWSSVYDRPSKPKDGA